MAMLTLNIIILTVVLLLGGDSLSYVSPRFEMERLSNVPLISSWNNNSVFTYNFNSGYMPSINDSGPGALLVRVQNIHNGSKTIYGVDPSRLAVSQIIDNTYLNYTYIREQDVVIDIDREYQTAGCEDPRIVLYNNTYYV